MTSLTSLTLKGALDGLEAGDFTSVELTRAHIEAVEAARGLNAFLFETPEQALSMAAASDARRALGEGRPLDGAPLGIKDLFCTEGVRPRPPRRSSSRSSRLRVDRHQPAVARRGGDAGQAEPRRIRHGLVQRDQRLRPGDQSLAQDRLQPP
jgi:Asp-tRNA(Asn)/Glu-tRNA(Gln) amidotransferase A subunit family amidase